MRFLIDTQLPKLLANHLCAHGEQALHVLELTMADSPDNLLWQYAIENTAVIITKDEDFAEWILAGRPGPQVVWLRVGNCTNTELLNWLMPCWPHIVDHLRSGERLVEVI